MPVKIETTITQRNNRSPFDRTREKVSFASDDQDYYSVSFPVGHGRGEMTLKMQPTEGGQRVREVTVFIGDELDEAGNLVEHEMVREKLLKNVGDSFSSTMRTASIGNREVTTREITFTRIEKVPVSQEVPAA